MMSDKAKWSLVIGRLILESNEVDVMLTSVLGDVFKQKPSKTWWTDSFGKRCKKIYLLVEQQLEKIKKGAQDAEKIDHDGMKHLKHLLERTLHVIDVRNHVAHGTFVLDIDGANGNYPVTEFSLMRMHKDVTIMSFEKIKIETLHCKTLSDDFSRFLAVYGFRQQGSPAIYT